MVQKMHYPLLIIFVSILVIESTQTIDICRNPVKWTIDGRFIMSENFGKVLFVACMRLDCPYCRRQMSQLNALHRMLKDVQFTVIAPMNESNRIVDQWNLNLDSETFLVFKENHREPVWHRLSAHDNDFFIFDRCGRLAYFLSHPQSNITAFRYTLRSLRSAVDFAHCGWCNYDVHRRRLPMDSIMETTTATVTATATKGGQASSRGVCKTSIDTNESKQPTRPASPTIETSRSSDDNRPERRRDLGKERERKLEDDEREKEIKRRQKMREEREREMERRRKLEVERNTELERRRKLEVERNTELERRRKLEVERNTKLERRRKLEEERNTEVERRRKLRNEKNDNRARERNTHPSRYSPQYPPRRSDYSQTRPSASVLSSRPEKKMPAIRPLKSQLPPVETIQQLQTEIYDNDYDYIFMDPEISTTPSVREQIPVPKQESFDVDNIPCYAYTDAVCFEQQERNGVGNVHQCCDKGVYFSSVCVPNNCGGNGTYQLCCFQKFIQARHHCCHSSTVTGAHLEEFSRCCFSRFVEWPSSNDPCCPAEIAAAYWSKKATLYELCLPNVEADFSNVRLDAILKDNTSVSVDLGIVKLWQFTCPNVAKRHIYFYYQPDDTAGELNQPVQT